MAFITNASGNVISFAEYTDLLQKDQRLLEANEIVVPEESGFLDKTEFLENMCELSTNRILLKMQASTWWRNYNSYVGADWDINNLPQVNPDRIDPSNTLKRQQQFTDMCVYYTFKEYLVPLIADFGSDESEGVAKIKYYDVKFNDIYEELLAITDWYDADGDGTVETSEKATYIQQSNRRSRRRTTIARIR